MAKPLHRISFRKIREHGHWRRYIPKEPPPGVPANVAFSRREEDGKDWYVFLAQEPMRRASRVLEADTVKLTVSRLGLNPSLQVQQVSRDATSMFPQEDALLLEIWGVPQDPDPLVDQQNLYKEFQMHEFIPPDTFLEIPPPLPMVNDRQFFQALAMGGLITEQEALDAVQTGTIPKKIGDYIDSLPKDEQFAAKMYWGGQVNLDATHVEMHNFMHAQGWSDEQIIDLFAQANTL